MTAHFEVFRAREPCAVVVEIPHAGLVIDESAAAFTKIPDKALRAGALVADSDLGADVIWEGTEDVGVTRVVARTSRHVIDLNTNPRPAPIAPFYEDDPEPRRVRRRSHCGQSWMQPAFPKAERHRRIAEILEPYHAAIDVEIERARASHRAVCLVAAHTFPDLRRATADVVIGTQHGARASAEVRDAVAAVARMLGLSVALEAPFRGGWSITRHARPSDGIHAIQIEIARRCVTGSGEIGAPIDPSALERLRGLATGITRALVEVLGARRG